MAKKIWERREKDTRLEATRWAAARAISVEEYCRSIDADLWAECAEESRRMEIDARSRLSQLEYDLGGGGAHSLLRFLVRRQRPQTVVETGVAAGWSSRAILEALSANGKGRLFSSDFPYFRLPDPESYVGYVVPEELRASWKLDTRGDEVALPEILREVDRIDLFHFDSDKSRAGRRFALELVVPRLAPGAIVVMDDIQDNTFFRDWVAHRQDQPIVFTFGGKYLGAVGLDSRTL